MSKKPLLVCIGNSIVNGFPHRRSQCFASLIREETDYDVINKGVTEEDLTRSVTDAFSCGWSSVKLYFMTGLPTETDEDLEGIGKLAQNVIGAYFGVPKEKRGKGLRITCSASVFVPKPFTPFQWAAQDTLEVIREKQEKLRHILGMKFVHFNWHEGELSLLEACISRGDRRIGAVIRTAWENGCRFDSWNEHFRFDVWMNAFSLRKLPI